MLFVNFSFKDVTPKNILSKTKEFRFTKPFIHLQHGVFGLKKYGINGQSYGNNIIRFCYYNKEIKEKLKEENNYKDYQLFYSEYMPLFGELLRKNNEINDKNQIFWFLTARDYFKKKEDSKLFVRYIKAVVESKLLNEYLKENNLILHICVHKLFKDFAFEDIKNYCVNDFIRVTKQNSIDFIEELAKSFLLITDYSSAAYNFVFLNKPILLYQPDLHLYKQNRDVFFDEELEKFSIRNPWELINKIVCSDFKRIPYLEKAFKGDINYDHVIQDGHLKDLYEYFYSFQKNKITFIGYNFYGIGGTVNATFALAEGLLEQGYFVNLISLKRLDKVKQRIPFGLNLQYLYWDNSPIKKDKFDYFMYGLTRNYSYLKFDKDKQNLHPIVIYKLTQILKNIKSNTIVSTRESLHLFLFGCDSKFVSNKIYFFHTLADVFDEIFPNLIDQLKNIQIENAIFVTDKNRLSMKSKFEYENYDHYKIIGNSLVSFKMIEKNDIEPILKKDKYLSIYLLRISKEREDDLNNLIEFGKYMKQNEISNLQIDVFGSGDYVDQFINLLDLNNLNGIIKYKGETRNSTKEILKYDFMIDFSLNHSFGMTYIEGILNGKKVFCMKNAGSLEVMEDIPNSFIESYEWLCNQINEVYKIPISELEENYEKIEKKYSRQIVSKQFIDFLV